MNALRRDTTSQQETALSFVLSGLARLASTVEALDESLQSALSATKTRNADSLLAEFAAYLKRPAAEDKSLVKIARLFQLEPIEVLAVRLCMAVEDNLLIGYLLGHLQQPHAQNRPTIGLMAQAYAPQALQRSVQMLGQGNAVRFGLLQLSSEDVPLPEKTMRVPLVTATALAGVQSEWPGTSLISLEPYAVRFDSAVTAFASDLARRLATVTATGSVLVIRSGDAHEARAAADFVCTQMKLRAVLIHTEQLAGMACWLLLNGLVPVFQQWLTASERKSAASIPGYVGPTIILSGPEGDFEQDERHVLDWKIKVPDEAGRLELWRGVLGDGENRISTVAALAQHRHSAGRIAMLAARAKENLDATQNRGALDESITGDDIRAVVRRGDGIGLGALAELIDDEIDDSALVVSPELQQDLQSLVARCRMRERFPDGLGVSIQSRYRPSVRALFVGPSGTGKTLAVAWLATTLGMPLFRVDLSSITSKYIGETEKNLSQLLARAEQSEVVLLFDEADALFGKRTEVQDSNDRFANAQTNYLLQRMENYEGITVLTSNARNRLDDAFSRRFDAIVSFPAPGPEQRRELWNAHLGANGSGNAVESWQLNMLAAMAELTGGQIRNAVLRGAVEAAQDGSHIRYQHLVVGVSTEYRKLSRQLPHELRQTQISTMV